MNAAAWLILSGACSAALAQPSSVVGGPHNLSASGPGAQRAVFEDEVCIFCHAPHNSTPVRPLWNRAAPAEAYTIYTSRALDATLGQPTGTSKMCLSCHDGTIALGAVASRQTPIAMAGGVTVMPGGRSLIGTDLRDDHPVSFQFDSSLSARDPHLRSPGALPAQVRLDANGELQCTTCHDAHNNVYGSFLVMHNANSQLCVTCHTMGATTISGHAACNACHQTHTAPSGPYLLKHQTVTQTCVSCHDGSVPGAPNVDPDLHKAWPHDTQSPVDPDGPPREHATCTSCHDPHTMSPGSAPAGSLHPSLGRKAGVNASGAPVSPAHAEAEVCFACHADGASTQPLVSRRIAQNNTRLEFSPGAVSFHPVLAPGRNSDVPSLRPGWTTASMMHCSHCHASDSAGSPGAAAGPHGSNIRPLLKDRCESLDPSSESAAAYALCYQCHDRANLLDDRSFKEHKKHIVDLRTPCATCHDPHGVASTQGNSANNSKLINFATAPVQPDPVTHRLEFRSLGRFRGECYLTCHGVAHSPKSYAP